MQTTTNSTLVDPLGYSYSSVLSRTEIPAGTFKCVTRVLSNQATVAKMQVELWLQDNTLTIYKQIGVVTTTITNLAYYNSYILIDAPVTCNLSDRLSLRRRFYGTGALLTVYESTSTQLNTLTFYNSGYTVQPPIRSNYTAILELTDYNLQLNALPYSTYPVESTTIPVNASSTPTQIAKTEMAFSLQTTTIPPGILTFTRFVSTNVPGAYMFITAYIDDDESIIFAEPSAPVAITALTDTAVTFVVNVPLPVSCSQTAKLGIKTFLYGDASTVYLSKPRII